ncbi:hypothetical protein BKA70DRAFT_1099295 [Coprinopsis sp. MPI-PUGE-AT-0042]|nr:hypothetical protein BKA70DRAFT_1099295 [Coprinopsis sp. MPI-PUGE-AT-0042]
MTIADEDENPVDVQTGKPVLPHPYWYARVVGIFSAYVVHRSNPTARFKGQKMDFVWVRWLGRNLDDGVEGFEKGFFQRVGFLPAEEGEAFGFVDPAAIIRAAHIIPALEFEQVDNLLGPSVTRRQGEPPLDYPDYYVNPFPDRDMLFRFIGGAPGHGHPLPYYPLHPLELYGNHAPATNSDHASESDSEAESEESDGEQDPQLAQQLLRDEVDDYAYEIEEEQEVGTGEGLGSGDDSDEDGMNEDDGEESERDSDDEADSDQSELGAEDGEEIYSFIDDPATFGYGDL